MQKERELIVKIACGDDQAIALLTPGEVVTLKKELRSMQNEDPSVGWTMASIIACAVIWRGVEVIEKEFKNEQEKE